MKGDHQPTEIPGQASPIRDLQTLFEQCRRTIAEATAAKDQLDQTIRDAEAVAAKIRKVTEFGFAGG